MTRNQSEDENEEIGRNWCASKGTGWSILDIAGRGGTAPVFTVQSPNRLFALKILDHEFSSGSRKDESEKRVAKQVDEIGTHDCPHVIQVYEGGWFENRLFLLMNKAEGSELEKNLGSIPRDKIRGIVDQVARACIFLRKKGLCHRDIKSANIFISDDYERATLLDVSVLRDINDPIGLGTDDGGKLPVVATSRYSPPEYLFRLVDPSPLLWHALDVYQLGGLIHDLVMRQPMFAEEYKLSSENRYRFAWIVATQIPKLEAADVEPGLLMLGRRALDKNWERRSKMQLEDFLSDAFAKGRLGLSALGFPIEGFEEKPLSYAEMRHRLTDIMSNLDDYVKAYLHQHGITATHAIIRGDHGLEDIAEFEWDIDAATNPFGYTKYKLRLIVSASSSAGTATYSHEAILIGSGVSKVSEVKLELPDAVEGDDMISDFCSNSVAAITTLGTKLISGEAA